MFIRVSRVQAAPNQLDALVNSFKNTAMPALQKMSGYAGAVIGVNPGSGDGQAVSFWESRDAMIASRDAATNLRTETTQAASATVVSVHEYEVLVLDRATQPALPAFLRVTRTEIDPSRIDALAQELRDRAVPALRALAGFRALNAAVDRATGNAQVTTVWDSTANREASDTAIADLRRQIFDNAGARNPDVSLYEVKALEFVGAGVGTV